MNANIISVQYLDWIKDKSGTDRYDMAGYWVTEYDFRTSRLLAGPFKSYAAAEKSGRNFK